MKLQAGYKGTHKGPYALPTTEAQISYQLGGDVDGY